MIFLSLINFSLFNFVFLLSQISLFLQFFFFFFCYSAVFLSFVDTVGLIVGSSNADGDRRPGNDGGVRFCQMWSLPQRRGHCNKGRETDAEEMFKQPKVLDPEDNQIDVEAPPLFNTQCHTV